ncbi:MAG: DUF2877 domain-containing protein [Caldisericia bacterium]|nr:DUF2877 domain-containing protein [Caldisericia bacterium]
MKEKTLLKKNLETNIHKLELLSIGDRLHIGNYKLHSRFKRVVNFVKDGYLASVVTEEVGGGPVNIVIRGFPINCVKTLSVGDGFIIVNESRFEINKNLVYSSKIDFSLEFSMDRYKKNLNTLRDLLIFHSPERSLSFLLDKRREGYFKSEFERTFVRRIKKGADELFSGRVESGINLLKGVGYGLTPSGDDFISGVLSGLYILENLFNYDLTTVRAKIYKLSKTHNLISSSFLYFSSRGEFFERAKNLIISIIYKSPRDVEEYFFKLMGVGDTSGSDIGTGLFMTLMKGGEVWL